MKRLLALTMVVGGCVDAPPEDPVVEDLHRPGEDLQGRHLLGAIPDGLRPNAPYVRFSPTAVAPNGTAYSLSVTPAGNEGVNGANLVASDGVKTHVGADPWFVNLVLSEASPGTAQLRIDGVASVGSSAVYTLVYRASPSSPWKSYCKPGDRAIALHGGYDIDRVHQVRPAISFACADGVAYKCNSWGYVAGTAGPGDDNWDHHQACIQMANAAYCGGARSFTREQTPIVIRDFKPNYGRPEGPLPHPDPLPGDPDVHYFEAAWRADGGPAVCLSKLRWASLPPDPCPTLPDPRYDDDDGGRAEFCDDLSLTQLRNRGAVLFNGSKVMDAPFRRWGNPSTGDVVTTMRGFVDLRAGAVVDVVPPFPGYTTRIAEVGLILRNLPGTLDPHADMVPLYVHHGSSPQERVVSDGTAIEDLTFDPALDGPDFEGYAFQRPNTVPGLLPLSVCENPLGYDTRLGDCALASSLAGEMYVLPAP